MAQVTTRILDEAESKLNLLVQIQGDGTGELNQLVILSPSDLTPPRTNNRATFRVMKLWYGLSWFDVVLGFGTTLPKQVWTMTRDGASHVGFYKIGGLVDPAALGNPPPDDSGRLWISTSGLVLGSKGSIAIALQKTNAP